jgi:uncharacterized protein
MSLPAQIDPRKLALQGAVLEGEVFATDLTRLATAVSAVTSPLKATIQFARDESGQAVATGTASVFVDVICQRCLDAVNIELHANLSLQIIWSEDQISNVAPDREPWIVVDRMADLNAIIEDEVLLALPIVNYHRAEDCTGDACFKKTDSKSEEADTYSPFGILKQLKQ